METPEVEVEKMIADLNNQSETNQPAPPVVEELKTVEEPVKTEQKSAPDQVVKDISPDKARTMATRWVKTFSNAMKVFFSWTYRKSILKPGDEQAMAEFVKAHKGESEKQMQDAITSDSPMYDVSNRFDKYMKACESIPLDQDEIDSIAEPLQELIVKYKTLQLSPEWMLVISVAFVMLPRVTPLMPDLSKLFAGKQ